MKNLTLKRILKLLTPSFSSGFLCVCFGAFIAGAVFVTTSYLGSEESLQLTSINIGNYSDNKIVSAYQNVYFQVTDSSGLGNVSLFVFWALVGTVSYLTVVGILKGLHDINELKNETTFVHMNKKSLVREEAEKLVIRIVGLVLLFVALHITTTSIIPWGRDLARIGANETAVIQKIKDCFVAIIVVAAALHVDVILIRLVALRVRLFGEQLPEEIS